MNSFIDGMMLVAFVAFMIFLLGGYHKEKNKERDDD